MKRLVIAVLVLAALWSGYWMLGASAKQSALSGWFEARRSEGWQAEYSELALRGFPNRFDTTLSDLALADPATGLAWEAPFFQILMMSYQPTRAILVFPPQQTVATPYEQIRTTQEQMRASIALAPGPSLALERMVLVAEDVAMESSLRWQARMEGLRLAAEREPGADASYKLGLAADGAAIEGTLRAILDPAGTLPDRLDAATLDATLAFDRPWDRYAIERARPQPRRIELRLAEARWGGLELAAAGTLDVGPGGIPEGKITIKARNWRQMLRMARDAGAIPPGLAGRLEQGLELISGLSGNSRTLDIPLTFSGGNVSIGILPIAPAPRMILR